MSLNFRILLVALICIVAMPKNIVFGVLQNSENQTSEKSSSEVEGFKLCIGSNKLLSEIGREMTFTVLIKNIGDNDRNLEQIQSQTSSNYDSIVIAEYIESKVVRKKNYLEEVKKTNDLSAAIGGRVYNFKVKKVICRNEFVEPKDSNSNSLTKFSFFDTDGSDFYQLYEKKRKYLVFLSALPEQNKLKDKYELDTQTTYYSPYPFSDAVKNGRRVKEISSELNDNYLTQMKSLCVEQRSLPIEKNND